MTTITTPDLDAAPITEPYLSDGDPLYTHIVNKEALIRSQMTGEPVEALCGKLWVPTRDPQHYPVCTRCIEVAGAIGLF